jgi:hypothetical protein
MNDQRPHKHLPPPRLADLGLQPLVAEGERRSGERLRRPKRFRFQLLGDYIAENFDTICPDGGTRIADVGGGKGMLAYLLGQHGYECTVLDPQYQPLPDKYRDLRTGKRVRIPTSAEVPHRAVPFETAHGRNYDLLVGLHAHGSNLAMLESAACHQTSVVLLPCCVIGEPEAPAAGQSWFVWLTGRATALGLKVTYFHLNFKGQNIGFIAART